MADVTRVVMFSGGAGSWAAARRVVDEHGPGGVVLLFADTLMEDEDLYRFLGDAALDLGVPVTRIADGRTPWGVFRDVRYLGNTRVDPCSRVLKRDLMRAWLEEHSEPTATVVYLGIDWTEAHRFTRAAERWKPWAVDAPLCRPPFLDKRQILDAMEARGIAAPRLYRLGFPHNNCGGFCVKAGQAQFAKLLTEMPARYAEHEAQEEALREHLGKDVAVLRDRADGSVAPLTMRAFRERLQADGGQFDLFEWGGCGCLDGDDSELVAPAPVPEASDAR